MPKILSLEPPRESFRLLTLVEWCKEKNIQFEIEQQSISKNNFLAELEAKYGTFDFILLNDWAQMAYMQTAKTRVMELAHLGVADAVVRKQSVSEKYQYWPKNYLAQAFREVLVAQTKNVDLEGSALIVGVNPLARVTLFALGAIGIRRFIISDPSAAEAEAFIKSVQQTNFGMQIRFVKDTDITQLPSICSFAVNTLNQLTPGLAQEISYFNFLPITGYWIDFGLNSYRQEFIDEIQSTKTRTLSPVRVWSVADRHLMQDLAGASPELNWLEERYEKALAGL